MQDHRGREATRPTEIPASGWKSILWRVYGEISDDRVMLIAAGVTYYLLLAFIPGLTAMISIYGLFSDPSDIQNHMSTISAFVPGGGMDILNEQLSRITSQSNSTLGLTFIVSILIALWSANAGMKSLFEAMNVAYDEDEKRGFVKLTLASFVFTIAAIIGVIVMVGVVVVLPAILDLVGLGEGTDWLIRIVSYVAVLLLASLGAAALYRWGPSRSRAKWRWITPGTVLSVLIVIAVSLLFSWYVANFGSYNKTYGSLGALIGFLTWIWLSVTILIIGGELNSEMEHQTARDTTTSPERPLGQRGAVMADRVADGPGDIVTDPSAGERVSSRTAAGRPKGRLSAGTLAVAVPAALLLAFMQRRAESRGEGN